MDRLSRGKLERENVTLKKQNVLFRFIIEQNRLVRLIRRKSRSRDGAQNLLEYLETS